MRKTFLTKGIAKINVTKNCYKQIVKNLP